jgi:hypothetical protein
MRKIAMILVPLAAAAALGACATKGYDDGYGVGYSAAWGDPYWGWYGDYYYPGTGIYVYDVHHRRTAWNDDQRRYWEGRHTGWRGPHGSTRSNWGGFRHRTAAH